MASLVSASIGRFQVGNISRQTVNLRVLPSLKMDQTISREKDFEVDLESGGNTSEDDECRDLDFCERQSKSWAWNKLLNFDGSKKRETGVETCCSSSKSDDAMDDNIELLVDTHLEDVQNELSHVKNNNDNEKKKKKKKTNSKPPKPPRPPKGPSLDAADQKLVKELAELALRKRARIKKLRAMRNVKARKASSPYTGLSALVITIVFLTVIILQGIKSGSSTDVGLMSSPEPAVAVDEGLISVHIPKNFSGDVGAAGSQYPTVYSFSTILSS